MGDYFGDLLDTDDQVGENTRRMRWTEPYVVMAEYGHITVFDCTDPSALVVKQRYEVLANQTPDGLIVEHPLIYVAQGSNRVFYILDMTDPTALSLRDSMTFVGSESGSFACDAAKQGNYVYIAGNRVNSNWDVIQIMNVSDPDNITQEDDFVDAVNLPTTPTGVAVDVTGKWLFVAGSEYFTVLDISDPANPVFSNRISTSPSAVNDFQHIEITEDGKYAYVVKYTNNSLSIIDVSNPASVSQVGTLTDSTYLYGVRDTQIVDDIYLYSFSFLGATFYVSVWDIATDPTSPTRLESVDITDADPWGDAQGRLGGFIIDPYQNLYIGRYTGSAKEGIASFGIEVLEDGLYVELAGTEIQADVLGLSTDRGRDDELADTATGQAVLTVDNVDGDYSPENTGGAYYGTLELGAAIEIYEVIIGVRYDIFTGKIDKIIPKDSAWAENRTADIVVLDGMDDMAQREISIAKLTDTTVDALVDDALDEVGWPAGDRSLDAGVDVFEQGWAYRESCLVFIQDVVRQDGAFFYIDVDGTATLENRHHRITGAHLISQNDFGASIADVDYEYSKRFLYNYARVTGKTYNADAANSLLWYAKCGNDDEAPAIGPGETVTMIAEMSLGLSSYTTLAEGTHWNANSQSDGGGDDLGAYISLVETQKGQSVELAFTNSGSVKAYLITPTAPPGGETNKTALVYGKLLQEAEITFVREDATSQAAYGERSFEYTARFQSRPAQIVAYADFIMTRYADVVPSPVSFTIEAENSLANRIVAVNMKLSDRITLASTRLGFDQDFYINKIVHSYDIRGSKYSHRTTFYLERTSGVAEGVAWLLGTIGFGELGQKTYLVW